MGASKEFAGGTDNVEVSTYSGMTDIFTGGGNISFWTKLNSSMSSNGSALRFLDKSSGPSSTPTEGWACYRIPEDVSNDRMSFFIMRESLAISHLNVGIPFDEWVHLSLNWGGDAEVPPVQFHNGVNVGSMDAFSNVGSFEPDTNIPVVIGNSPNEDRPLEAEMCYVHMYDKELTIEEINEIMHKPGSIRDGLVGFWTLTDDGSTQRNLSGIGNNGTVTGATNSADGPPISKYL